MPRNSLQWGNWNAICDVCGFKFKSEELRKDWKGHMVCEADYEDKHPQLNIRVRGDNPSVPWTRPETDTFVPYTFCTIEGLSAIPGYAIPGCMIPGRILAGVPLGQYCTPEGKTTTPGYFMAGCAIPGISWI